MNTIYDGSFPGKLIHVHGVFAGEWNKGDGHFGFIDILVCKYNLYIFCFGITEP